MPLRQLAAIVAVPLVLIAGFTIRAQGGLLDYEAPAPTPLLTPSPTAVPGASTGNAFAAPSGSAALLPTPSPDPRTAELADCPLTAPTPVETAKRVVRIETAAGAIDITLDPALSPIAVENFLALVRCGYYNGVAFHRVAKLADGTPFVIQGGDGQFGIPPLDPSMAGTGGPGYTIPDEPVGAEYGRGTVAMARTAEVDSAGSQFFIVLSDAARPPLESANTYQIMGQVSAGMETVDAIAAAADAELPSDPVVMTRVSLIEAQ